MSEATIMSEARNRILARLREGRGPSVSAAVPDSPPPTAPMPDVEGMVRRFTERLEAVRAEVHRTSGNSWAATLWRLCAEKGIGNLLYGPHGPLAPALSEGAPDSLALVPCSEPVTRFAMATPERSTSKRAIKHLLVLRDQVCSAFAAHRTSSATYRRWA